MSDAKLGETGGVVVLDIGVRRLFRADANVVLPGAKLARPPSHIRRLVERGVGRARWCPVPHFIGHRERERERERGTVCERKNFRVSLACEY